MRALLLPCALGLAGCAPALAVTAAASIPPAVAATAPKSPEGEQPERDPQARGAGAFYASELPDDRDGNGVSERAVEGCADPERLEGCPRPR
jgi:hypothetical protein